MPPSDRSTDFRTATAKQLEEFASMVAEFKRSYPDFERPLTPEESVQMVLAVVDKATVADSGAFISHKGNKEWL